MVHGRCRACDRLERRAARPRCCRRLGPGLHQLTPDRYRDPTDLPDGGILIVGASATGVQLADELARAGRRVVVAAGRHSPLPRRYRGVDIMRWLDVLGVNRRDLDHVSDRATALQEPSLQLAGRPDQRDVHLAALQALGVHIVGRLSGADGERVASPRTSPSPRRPQTSGCAASSPASTPAPEMPRVCRAHRWGRGAGGVPPAGRAPGPADAGPDRPDVADALERSGPAAVEWKLDGIRVQVHRPARDVSGVHPDPG